MRKLTILLISLLLLSMLVVGTGCNKMTGGGWFIDEVSGSKITVGFNAQPLDEPSDLDPDLSQAKGQFQLIDHGTKDRIRVTFIATYDGDAPVVSDFGGPATINGEGGYIVVVEVHDNGEPGIQAGDLVSLSLFDEDEVDPENPLRRYYGWLGGGNVQVHEEEE